MTPAERERLTLIAKAMGLDVWFEPWNSTYIQRGKGPWNPLHRPADCWEMCAELDIDIMRRIGDGVLARSFKERFIIHRPYNGNKSQAAMDAACAVAAEIGRRMG